MLHIMNSAMMPTPWLTYRLEKKCEGSAAAIFENAVAAGESWKSYVGYPATARVASEVLGVEIPVSVEETLVKAGDRMLVLKLRYRVPRGEKAAGAHGTKRDEFDWFLVTISE